MAQARAAIDRGDYADFARQQLAAMDRHEHGAPPPGGTTDDDDPPRWRPASV